MYYVGQGGHFQSAEVDQAQEHPKQECQIADPVDDEGLLARSAILVLLEPESDQQVRAEANTFPSDEQQQQVVTEHQQQHEGGEQVQVGKVAVVSGVTLHVPDGVQVNERSDSGDHQAHDCAEAIKVKCKRDLENSIEPDPRESIPVESPGRGRINDFSPRTE